MKCTICKGWGDNFGVAGPDYDIDNICLGCYNGLAIHISHPMASCFGTGATINHFSIEEWEKLKKRFSHEGSSHWNTGLSEHRSGH
jgi:hypothetical protein